MRIVAGDGGSGYQWVGREHHNAVLIINYDTRSKSGMVNWPLFEFNLKMQIDNDTHLKYRINVNCFSSSRLPLLLAYH